MSLVRTCGQALYSLYFWSILFGGLLVALPAVFVVISVFERPKAWRVSQRIYKGLFFLLGVSAKVEGLEQLDRTAPYVLMGNHVNLLDHFLLCTVMPTPMIGIEDQKNYRIPIYGTLMRRWGNLPIDRRDPERIRATMAAAGQALRQGGLWLLIFPEGKMTRDGQLLPFKKGGFHLARDNGLPIVPFTLVGAYRISAAWRWGARPGHVRVVVSAPIAPAAHEEGGLEALSQAVRAAIVAPLEHAHSEETRV